MAAARYVLLVVGLVLVVAGMIGAVSGTFEVAPPCTATLPFNYVWYQGNVYDFATGANLAGVQVTVYDLTHANATIIQLAADSTGFYNSLPVYSPGFGHPINAPLSPVAQDGCDLIGLKITAPGHLPGWVSYYLPSNAVDCTVRTCYGYNAVQDFAMTKTPGVVAKFSYSANNLAVSFYDMSAGPPTSWSWAFGDGQTSTLQNPQHAYAQTGSYAVTLTVAGAGGSTSMTGTTITVAGAQQSSGQATAPPPPSAPTSQPPPTTNSTAYNPPTPGPPAPGAPGGTQLGSLTFTPSPAVIVLLVAGFILVIVAGVSKT